MFYKVLDASIRDESVPGSDIDLLVILRESEEPFLNKIPRFLPSRFK